MRPPNRLIMPLLSTYFKRLIRDTPLLTLPRPVYILGIVFYLLGKKIGLKYDIENEE